MWTSDYKLYLKRDWKKVYSCEFYELFNNTYIGEDLQMAVSETPVQSSYFNQFTSLTA